MAAKDIEAGRAHVLIAIRDRLSQGLKTAEAKLRAFGSSVALSAGVLTGGIGAAIAWPIKLAANMEQTKTSFAVFLGSTDLANKKLKEIEQLASVTPFTFDDLKDGATTLLQYGVSADALIPTLSQLGDASGGVAEKFQRMTLGFAQAMGAGRLMGTELKQLRDAGFQPLEAMSKITGKTFGQLTEEMEAGNISSRDLAIALAYATGPGGRFNGMMEKQSQTLIGLYSTLKDNTAMAARAFGDAMMPVLKTVVEAGITASKWITKFITNNQVLVGIAGKVALVLFAASGAVAAIGATILGVSFVIGLMASAFATLATVVGAVLSPIGIKIAIIMGLLIAAAGVAYYYRGAIMQALAPVVAFFQPVINSVAQLYGIFMQTFGGIVAALQSGSLQQAANIAWAGFSALAWTAIADVMGAFNSLLAFVESFLPGLSQMFNATFGSITQALLNGDWALAGQIAMNKLGLVLVQGFNNISALWDMSLYGISYLWDTFVTGMQTGFRTAIYGIAELFLWLAEQAYEALRKIEEFMVAALNLFGAEMVTTGDGTFSKQMQDLRAQLEAGRAGNQQASDKSFNQRDQDRQSHYGKKEAERNALEEFMRADIARMERRAKAGGSATFESKAADAQKALEEALANAKKERELKAQQGYKAAEGPQALAGAASAKTGGKSSGSSGTFSAIASALGNVTNSAVENTAKNTAQLVKIAKQQLAKPAVGMDQ